LPSTELRVGIVGLGWIGGTHARTIESLPDAALVATADQRAGAARYGDWEGMLENERLDAVVVATPPAFHRPIAERALDMGTHVYLEKPVAHNLEDAQRIEAAAERSAAVCAVGYQYRAISFLGDLPRDLRLLAGSGLSDTLDRDWMRRRDLGGSHLLERASHLIDLEMALAGPVIGVFCAERDDRVAVTLRFASGALGTVIVGRVADGPGWRLDCGTEQGHAAIDLSDLPSAEVNGERLAHTGRPLLEESLVRFLAAARAGQRSMVACGVGAGVDTLLVTLAAERSAQEGVEVAVLRRNA
jgi:predicted dehydrogenase